MNRFRLWWTRRQAAAAAAANQISLADVNTIDEVTGTTPLTQRTATAAAKLDKRLVAAGAKEATLSVQLARVRRNKLNATLALDAVNRVKTKTGGK
ncbi:MAG TPA: hypothetical protein VJ227_00405 [Patescibacteria group bacterium]|nr:hypothetical protein [Patescibacteria group bacterium]